MANVNPVLFAVVCNLALMFAACTVPVEVVAREDSKTVAQLEKEAPPVARHQSASKLRESADLRVPKASAAIATTEAKVLTAPEPAVLGFAPKSESAQERVSASEIQLATMAPAMPSKMEPSVPATITDGSFGAAATNSPTPTPAANAVSTTNSNPPLGIRGTMSIAFGSRLQEGGIDTYDVDLVCADALRFKGKIIREPREVSSILGRETKPQELQYHLILSVINPANRSEEKRAGAYSGSMKVTGNGVYDLSPLKISTSLPAYSNPQAGEFGGRIRGKAEERKGIVGATYTRFFGGKKVALVLKNVDPLAFENVRIAAGPLSIYPSSDVSGNLDFDYDTGNWITSGITFKNSPTSTDLITGSIKWIPDEDRNSSGKSHYEFNLRYNEASFNPTTDEASFFASASDEEAFFAVDERVPTLKGTISYKDTFGETGEDGEPIVVSSDIEYSLEGDKVTKDQLISFLKWWLLIVGPTNDE